MPLHPLAEPFATVAESYERGRPEYAPEVIDALCADLALAPGARVLDLAAGTGKLTRALIAGGLDVVAVEPQAPLRALLVERVGEERVHDGLAEAIPLPAQSVEAVTIGDAFHWFDHQPALAEIRRVLRPGGGLALFRSSPDWRGASWAHEVGTLMSQARPEHPAFNGPSWYEIVLAAGGWGALREMRISSSQPTDPARILDYVGSVSWFAAMPEERRGELLAQVRELIAAGETPAEMGVHVSIGLASLD